MKAKERSFRELTDYINSAQRMLENIKELDWQEACNVSTQLGQALNACNRLMGALDAERDFGADNCVVERPGPAIKRKAKPVNMSRTSTVKKYLK